MSFGTFPPIGILSGKRCWQPNNTFPEE
uniref:Uncharacterized protein n=1 Tax=Anguilla anguilla TaxID=7936 RepID=A0A0E9RZ59_ANGAN